MNIGRAVRLVAVALIAAATFVGGVQAASAAPIKPLTDDLAELWETVLQTPNDQNPFADPDNPDAITCWQLGGNVVAPFGPSGATSCTVSRGTRIFIVGSSGECSTFEVGSDACPTPDLAAGARGQTRTVTSVTVDGQPVELSYVETSVQSIKLPANNLFGVPAGSRGEFVAVGWVTLLTPLPVGTHTIVGPGFTTTIVVQ